MNDCALVWAIHTSAVPAPGHKFWFQSHPVLINNGVSYKEGHTELHVRIHTYEIWIYLIDLLSYGLKCTLYCSKLLYFLKNVQCVKLCNITSTSDINYFWHASLTCTSPVIFDENT